MVSYARTRVGRVGWAVAEKASLSLYPRVPMRVTAVCSFLLFALCALSLSPAGPGDAACGAARAGTCVRGG